MNHHWENDSFIYHIYPLGLCGAPYRNNFNSNISFRLDHLYNWINHIQNLGVNVVCLGPLFESTSHGYDTADYYHVDRRLGNRESLANIVNEFHKRGIRVIFDAVFNHVGRDFWAFRDVLKNNHYSWYCDWFQGLKFGKRSPSGDLFTYKSWKGHYHLVKLNLKNPYVKEHLFKAVEMWIYELGVDGLRLDAADCLKVDFIKSLKRYCKKIKPDFWLLGEIVKGDYRKKVNEKMLDSATNYQCYKELFSCFNNRNFFEIAQSFKWQFDWNGIYKDLNLYSFVDNHDVNRIASKLKNQSHLYPLYALLFTMPGIPSIYYGSEFGIKGKRSRHSDKELRPYLDPYELYRKSKNIDLPKAIERFSAIRQYSEAIRYGGYKELFVMHEQFAFARITHNEYIIVIINSSEHSSSMEFYVPEIYNGTFVDLLNPNEIFFVKRNKIQINYLWPNWARILKFAN